MWMYQSRDACDVLLPRLFKNLKIWIEDISCLAALIKLEAHLSARILSLKYNNGIAQDN